MLTFNKKYFALAIALFIIEVFIAVYINDNVIRPYAGDLLVVILLYCIVRTFLNVSALKVVIAVLLFSFLLEILQHFEIVKLLGLQDNEIARTVIGTGFDWLDLLAYTVGVLMVLWFERPKPGQVRKKATTK